MFVQLSRGMVKLFVGLAVLQLATSIARAQFDDLLRRVPANANALILIDVNGVFETPQARSENWRGLHEKSFASGLTYLPPDAARFVLAAQMDLDSMQPDWEAVLMEMPRAPSLALVARQYKGSIDKVAEMQAVALPGGAYVVQLGPQLVGALAPANRQSVSRWVRDVQSASPPALSSYLKQAAAGARQSKSPIVLAIDLQDLLPRNAMRQKLDSATSLAKQTVDKDKLADAIASVHGLTLEIRITDKTHGQLQIEFGQDVSLMAAFAKPMLLEALSNGGAMIDDFQQWQAKAGGKTLTLEGPMSATGLRRVLSLIQPPTGALQRNGDETGSDAAAQQKAMGQASLTHFRSVQSLLDDQRAQKGKEKTLGQVAMWMDNYARKIERLPVLNVDPDLLNYSGYVAEQLHNASMAVKGIGIRSTARSAQIYPAVSGGYSSNNGGYYGYFDVTNVDSERRAVRAEEKAAGATDAIGIMQQVENVTSKVRRDMSQKYQIEF